MGIETENKSIINLGSNPEQETKTYNINVDNFIKKYKVEDQKTIEVLRDFPTLCYLLGNVTEEPQGTDSSPDGINRHIFYLTEGSGMFGLKNPEDAQRWKGIFNHIMGSSRHVYFLSEKINASTANQKQELFDLGFDINSLRQINPKILRDFMFVNHAARRRFDERKWHNLRDDAHPEGESEDLTTNLLLENDAPEELINLMRAENHTYLTTLGRNNYLPNLSINILTYGDWTFGQKPVTIKERFTQLRKSRRQPEVVLNKLENFALYFEKSIKKIFGESIFSDMIKSGPYRWETKIRDAYCSASGLTIEDVFPSYRR